MNASAYQLTFNFTLSCVDHWSVVNTNPKVFDSTEDSGTRSSNDLFITNVAIPFLSIEDNRMTVDDSVYANLNVTYIFTKYFVLPCQPGYIASSSKTRKVFDTTKTS